MRAEAKKQFAKKRGGGRLRLRAANEEWPEWNGRRTRAGTGQPRLTDGRTVEVGLEWGEKD